MYLNSYFMGIDMAYLPPNGELVCHIPRVHLAPGRYRLEVWVKSNEVMQDRISDAGMIEVTEGNFFGSGRALAEGFQVALMDFEWSARSSEERSEEMAAVAAGSSENSTVHAARNRAASST
jgi:hypothetical protein